MNTVKLPIIATGVTLANRQDVFQYIIDNFVAYYDTVNIVQQNEKFYEKMGFKTKFNAICYKAK